MDAMNTINLQQVKNYSDKGHLKNLGMNWI